MASYDYALAGNGTLGTVSYGQWITGGGPVQSGPFPIAAGQILDKYTVLARNAAGAMVPLDTTQTDSRAKAVCVLMHAINTTAAQATTPLGITLPANPAGAVDTLTECYRAGTFNPDLAVWPSNLTTATQRARQFDGTMIRFQRPL